MERKARILCYLKVIHLKVNRANLSSILEMCISCATFITPNRYSVFLEKNDIILNLVFICMPRILCKTVAKVTSILRSIYIREIQVIVLCFFYTVITIFFSFQLYFISNEIVFISPTAKCTTIHIRNKIKSGNLLVWLNANVWYIKWAQTSNWVKFV